MAGLPICNPSVRVQAVAFCEWQESWLGVMVTPWMISLVLIPRDNSRSDPAHTEEKITVDLPSGIYEFVSLNEPRLGVCHTRSLLSPLLDIERHEDAIDIAEQVMIRLFESALDDQQSAADRSATLEQARLKGESILDKPISRRDFLRGTFWGT